MQRQLFMFIVALACCFSNAQTSVSSSTASAAGGSSSLSGASVSGNIKFDGPLPKTAPIAMRADPACAAEHPQPTRSEDVVTGQSGTLENVIVFVSQGAQDRPY